MEKVVAPHQDPEVLRKLYFDERLTIEQIADRLDVTSVTISNWFRKHGIHGDTHRGGRREKLYAVGTEKLTVREIMARTGLSKSTVCYRLKTGKNTPEELAKPAQARCK